MQGRSHGCRKQWQVRWLRQCAPESEDYDVEHEEALMGHEHTQDSNLLCARCKDYPKCAAIMVAQNGTAEPRMMSCRSRAIAHRVAAWESMPWEAVEAVAVPSGEKRRAT